MLYNYRTKTTDLNRFIVHGLRAGISERLIKHSLSTVSLFSWEMTKQGELTLRIKLTPTDLPLRLFFEKFGRLVEEIRIPLKERNVDDFPNHIRLSLYMEGTVGRNVRSNTIRPSGINMLVSPKLSGNGSMRFIVQGN